MRRSSLHTVEVQLTREECRVLRELAAVRGQTAPEFLRDVLRLGPLEEQTQEKAKAPRTRRHLHLVACTPPDTTADRPGCA